MHKFTNSHSKLIWLRGKAAYDFKLNSKNDLSLRYFAMFVGNNLAFHRDWYNPIWIVGILVLLWNSLGALDYLMIQTQNAIYMASFSQQQFGYFYTQSVWMVCAWAIAI